MTARRALLLATLGAASCSVLPTRPYETRRQWPLLATRPTTLPARPAAPVLLVRTLRAGPGLEQRGLRRVQPDGSVASDFYEEWAVPPAEGVENALRLWLAASGRFAAVLAPGSRLPASRILEGELTDFTADPPAGVARIGLALVELADHAGHVTPLWQRSFVATAPLTQADAPALAASLRAALAACLAQVEAATL